MLIFQNDGLIPEEAIVTMGVNAKLGDNPIGQFGTGLKYSIAGILRNGGKVCIWRGKKRMEFGLSDKMIRGKGFKIVTLNGKKLGFTDQLGLNWKPWMFYRELYSNCKDEAGSIRQIVPTGTSPEELGEAKKTKIIVEWAELERIHENRNEIVLTTDPMYTLKGVEVHPMVDSPNLYYKRIRVYDLPKPSKFTYSLTGHEMLTEDRTLMYTWAVPTTIMKAILSCNNKNFLNAVLDREIVEKCFEESFNYSNLEHEKPSPEFLEVAERKMIEKRLVNGAHNLFKHYQDTLPGYTSPYILEDFTQVQLYLIEEAMKTVQSKFPDFTRSSFYFKTKQQYRAVASDDKIILNADLLSLGRWALARAMVEGLAALQKGGATEQLTHYILTGTWIPEELVTSYNSRADNYEPLEMPF